MAGVFLSRITMVVPASGKSYSVCTFSDSTQCPEPWSVVEITSPGKPLRRNRWAFKKRPTANSDGSVDADVTLLEAIPNNTMDDELYRLAGLGNASIVLKVSFNATNKADLTVDLRK